MELMRELGQFIAHFWMISVVVLVAVGVGVYFLIQAAFGVDTLAAKHQGSINNIQYQSNQQSQMYQDTFLSQAGKDYQQVTVDKLNIDQAKASGDSTQIADAYAAAAADIHIFCGVAQKLTTYTQAQFTPGEQHLYAESC